MMSDSRARIFFDRDTGGGTGGTGPGDISRLELQRTKEVEDIRTRANALEIDLSLLGTLFRTLDYTSLGIQDNPSQIERFVLKLVEVRDLHPELGSVAAVCVYPRFAEQVAKLIEKHGFTTPVAVVESAFPHAQEHFSFRIPSAEAALAAGAQEIDMVINVGTILEQGLDSAICEVGAFSDLCEGHFASLKVILNTSSLMPVSKDFSQWMANVRLASEAALIGGADFLKTSSGKEGNVASLPDFIEMLLVLAEYRKKDPEIYGACGIKASGGISEIRDALSYMVAAETFLKIGPIHPHWFRIGASKLFSNIVDEATALKAS